MPQPEPNLLTVGVGLKLGIQTWMHAGKGSTRELMPSSTNLPDEFCCFLDLRHGATTLGPN